MGGTLTAEVRQTRSSTYVQLDPCRSCARLPQARAAFSGSAHSASLSVAPAAQNVSAALRSKPITH